MQLAEVKEVLFYDERIKSYGLLKITSTSIIGNCSTLFYIFGFT
jgi:hypothetical protein